MTDAGNPRWLDSLARRSVRRDGPEQIETDPVPARGGLSRRALLQTSAAAAVFSGPLRLLLPATAAADALDDCARARNKPNVDDLVDCVKRPIGAYKANRSAIRKAVKALAGEKRSAQRRKLLAGIDRATLDQQRAVDRAIKCNVRYHKQSSRVLKDCTDNPPAPSGPNPLPPPPPPSGSDQCLNCQSVGGVCCMAGADLCACATPGVPCSRYGCG